MCIYFQNFTIYDLGSSSKPNAMDYEKVKKYYNCNNTKGNEIKGKWNESMIFM